MNILFALGHPAHYHLFKNITHDLKSKGHNVHFVITPKDVLESLLISNNEDYSILAQREHRNNLLGKLLKIVKSTKSLISIAQERHADILIGCLSQIAYTGVYLRIPTIFVGEDDFSYTWLQGIITYPFVSHILAPTTTNISIFSYKKIPYTGYQKLAYLHPNYFAQNKVTGKKDKKQILIRLVNLSAYHDISAQGLNNKLLSEFINTFEAVANICISSERELPPTFEKYRVKIEASRMHEFLLNSDLFIGDSQSMAVEASLLGIPNIRINNFAGKISILNELEFRYGLTISLSPAEVYKLFDISKEIIGSNELSKILEQKRTEMLADKIDVTAFMVWFIENYPMSVNVVRDNPSYQNRFK